MPYPKEVCLLTGGNIEPRMHFLKEAEKAIQYRIGEITRKSSVYESEAWGFESENKFLNRVLLIRTDKSDTDLLNEILNIEQKLGRKRAGGRYTSRTIDIDILYIESEIIRKECLTVPHPRLHERKFTLLPLVELMNDFEHPVLKLTNKQLLDNTKDKTRVWLYSTEHGI